MSALSRRTYCLDTSLLVKVLVPEDGSDEAADLVRQAISGGCRLVAPAFAWAEVGTALKKKARAGLVTEAEADTAWKRFMSLAIEYLSTPRIPEAAWGISTKFGLPTLYDAAFLAVCDSVSQESRSTVEFWTADRELVKNLGYSAPKYVRLLTPKE